MVYQSSGVRLHVRSNVNNCIYKLSMLGTIQYSEIIKTQVGLSREKFIAAVFLLLLNIGFVA